MFRSRPPSDDRVVREVLAGERERFGVLVELYLPAVHALAYARTGNHADAEDVSQEAFLQAFQSLDSLREWAKFGPWLMGITRHCASRVTRKARPQETFSEETGGQPAPAADMERRELERMLWDQVRDLDERQREVIVLHYFGGKTSGEIAALLGLSDDAVRKRLERARAALGEGDVEAAWGGAQAQAVLPGAQRAHHGAGDDGPGALGDGRHAANEGQVEVFDAEGGGTGGCGGHCAAHRRRGRDRT